MTRFLWIVGFSITVLMFSLMTVLSAAAVVRKPSIMPWAMLVTFGSSVWFL
jgi:hypothetical protein